MPGAHVVQSGGQGSYSTVSLRGGELGHTSFLLGEMPVSGPDSGPLDLSLLPLEVFDRLEVYREGAPAFFDSGAIGGVVRLVPREDRESRLFASATGGSFGAWRADVTSTLRRSRSNTCTPSRSSALCTCADSAGCEMPSAVAALRKLPCWAAAFA